MYNYTDGRRCTESHFKTTGGNLTNLMVCQNCKIKYSNSKHQLRVDTGKILKREFQKWMQVNVTRQG